jgi:hypothetical protein
VLRCKKRALGDEEREIVASAPSIDELVPRMTADEQKKFIEEQILGQESGSGELPPEAQEAQEGLEDLPY